MILRIAWEDFEQFTNIFNYSEGPALWYKESDDRFTFLFFRDGAAISTEILKKDIVLDDDVYEEKERKLKAFFDKYCSTAYKFLNYGGI